MQTALIFFVLGLLQLMGRQPPHDRQSLSRLIPSPPRRYRHAHEDWHTFMVLTDRNLLKQRHFGPNFFCIEMYDDAIAMGNQKNAAYLTIQGDVCTGDNTPESMAQHGNHFDPYG